LLAIRDWGVRSGRFFDDDNVRTNRKVAVLGGTVADGLFPDQDPVGQEIRLRNVPFEIIGVLSRKGQTANGSDQDDVVLAPYTTVHIRLAGRSFIAQILAETATATTEVMTALLAAIASISLLVGGIGIMNIMLVSVTERTREIGIRLAIGARGSDVLTQFLVESTVMSVFGSLLGVGLRRGAAKLLSQLTGWSTVVSPATELLKAQSACWCRETTARRPSQRLDSSGPCLRLSRWSPLSHSKEHASRCMSFARTKSRRSRVGMPIKSESGFSG
jgi:putative ABC transport system permease protein